MTTLHWATMTIVENGDNKGITVEDTMFSSFTGAEFFGMS